MNLDALPRELFLHAMVPPLRPTDLAAMCCVSRSMAALLGHCRHIWPGQALARAVVDDHVTRVRQLLRSGGRQDLSHRQLAAAMKAGAFGVLEAFASEEHAHTLLAAALVSGRFELVQRHSDKLRVFYAGPWRPPVEVEPSYQHFPYHLQLRVDTNHHPGLVWTDVVYGPCQVALTLLTRRRFDILERIEREFIPELRELMMQELHWAIRHHHRDVVDWLVAGGAVHDSIAPIYYRDKYTAEPLLTHALMRGNTHAAAVIAAEVPWALPDYFQLCLDRYVPRPDFALPAPWHAQAVASMVRNASVHSALVTTRQWARMHALGIPLRCIIDQAIRHGCIELLEQCKALDAVVVRAALCENLTQAIWQIWLKRRRLYTQWRVFARLAQWAWLQWQWTPWFDYGVYWEHPILLRWN